jgi:hypothetical protein
MPSTAVTPRVSELIYFFHNFFFPKKQKLLATPQLRNSSLLESSPPPHTMIWFSWAIQTSQAIMYSYLYCLYFLKTFLQKLLFTSGAGNLNH